MSRLIQAGLPCQDCGSSDALARYENNTYCFSCHAYTSSTPVRASHSSSITLGELTELPLDAKRWLKQYNCPSHPSLRWSVLHKGIYVPFTHAKAPGGHIRIIQPSGGVKGINIGPSMGSFFKAPTSPNRLVIVEDLRSALKVFACNVNVLCLFGTKLHTKDA